MKNLVLTGLFISCFSVSEAQTNSTTIPNSGANTTVPPSNTYSTPGNNMSNPTNSTVPGASGSYSMDPSKPDMTNPNTNGTYTVYPNGTQGTTTYSPQTGTNSTQKKKSKK